MELDSSMSLLGALAVLALVDSTSLGTLGLPVWMLAQPRVRPIVVTAYLITIAVFYWLLGVSLLAGLGTALPTLQRFGETETAARAQVVVGAALFLASFLFDGPIGRWRRQRRERLGRPTRWQNWKARVIGPDARPGAAARIGLAAGAIEAVSMVPYIAGIGLITTQRTPVASGALILAAYCMVMILPALALLALRLTFARTLASPLNRLSSWFDRNGDDILAWTLGVVGFLVVSDAVGRLRSFAG